MQPTIFFSTDATPSHSSPRNLILNSKKSPASTQEVSESENRPATRGPSASVESIEPRPPRPCEVGRPKGRRRKSRRQSHKFFKHRRSGWHPNSPPRPGEAPPPPPPTRKSATQTAQKTAL